MNKWQRVRFQPNLPLGENGERVTASKAHRELSKNAAKEVNTTSHVLKL